MRIRFWLSRFLCPLGYHHWMDEKKTGAVKVKPGVWAEYRIRQCWYCPKMETAPSRVVYVPVSTGSPTETREGA